MGDCDRGMPQDVSFETWLTFKGVGLLGIDFEGRGDVMITLNGFDFSVLGASITQ